MKNKPSGAIYTDAAATPIPVQFYRVNTQRKQCCGEHTHTRLVNNARSA
jgi:hypothetical protein